MIDLFALILVVVGIQKESRPSCLFFFLIVKTATKKLCLATRKCNEREKSKTSSLKQKKTHQI